MSLTCKTIRTKAGGSWEDACAAAEEFVATLSEDQVVSISHVSESPYGVIFIWYRTRNDQGDITSSG